MGYILTSVDSRTLLFDIALLFAMLLLPLIGMIIAKSTFTKYSKINSSRGLTAEQAARQILDNNGLFDVRVEHVSGSFEDCYLPNERVVCLSDSTYGKTSISAIGAAAHECGHACQFDEGYAPTVLGGKLAPAMNFCSRTWYIVFIIGCVLTFFPYVMYAGVVMFSVVLIYQLVTLPLEFDASRRALRTLRSDSILEENEIKPARKVLTAAAITYVASLAASALQLIRLLLRARR